MTDSTEAYPLAHDDRETHVWLVRDADDRRAMHDMILIERGDERTILEAGPVQPERPVTALLALAGFTGAPGPSPEAATVGDDIAFVRLRGFTLKDPARAADAAMTARLALAGKLGGFHPVAHGQSGFHRAAFAFEHVWNAAGCPPIRVLHPELVDGPGASRESPGAIGNAAEQNTTLAAVRMLEGKKPGTRVE
jgi:hypothetical protein